MVVLILMNKTVGRPRSQAADDAIICAARKMFYKHPYHDVSMEAIAAEAGVSKATLYRRWPNKQTLAVEVLVRVIRERQLYFDSQNTFRQHLTANLRGLRDMLSSDYSDVIVSIIAETQHDKTLRNMFCQKFLQPVQAIGDADMQKAIEQGEVAAIVDKDLVFDQLFGLFYYRLLVAHKSISNKEIDVIVNAFFHVAGT